jgi:putative oxygen-independent coproporphyrinogen III oxidase
VFGLYIHIPFCAAICNYCNFNRGLFDGELKTRYVRALIAEIERAGLPGGPASGPEALRRGLAETRTQDGSSEGGAADTIYFGGGTPSLLAPEEVAAIIRACQGAFDLAADCEVTLEANPETVTTDTLRAFRHAGVNRLSFGVQSFRDDELRRLTRLHGADRAKAAYREARAAGFENVSLDLMMWLPGQQVSEWLESVDQAIALAPDHLSLYMLEVYPNSPLRDEMARSAWSQAPDDDVAEMYDTSMSRLEASGYQQYEISNVSRPGRQSRHNLKYWTDGEWFGFGCGAHSTVDGVRWKNVSATDEYVTRIADNVSIAGEVRRMTREERLGDALFTALRLSEGANIAAINERYGVDAWARFGADLEPFVESGLLEITESRWRLTRPGILLAHEVMAVFV